MRNIHRIPEAIADLESQEVPNVNATAEKYDVAYKTLEDQWKGRSTSMEEYISTYHQCLTNFQESALVELINDLTDYRMPLTTIIVKNLAEEIRGYAVGKNQMASFVRQHQKELKSIYLKGINNKRIKGKYALVYS